MIAKTLLLLAGSAAALPVAKRGAAPYGGDSYGAPADTYGSDAYDSGSGYGSDAYGADAYGSGSGYGSDAYGADSYGSGSGYAY